MLVFKAAKVAIFFEIKKRFYVFLLLVYKIVYY